jgi:hypothetical protein
MISSLTTLLTSIKFMRTDHEIHVKNEKVLDAIEKKTRTINGEDKFYLIVKKQKGKAHHA